MLLATPDVAIKRRRILVVDDAPEIAQLVKEHLKEIADPVVTVGNGAEALALAQREHFDLIVLDLMLPGMDGLEVCRALRVAGRTTPIFMLTAKATELDRIVGLEYGADDYLVKPFSVLELTARVKALFRRVDMLSEKRAVEKEEPIRFGDFVLDPVSRELRRSGKRIPLTTKEFELLHLFASNPGRAYARSQLLDLVWGYGGGVYEHTVNSHINRLRAKIETDPAKPALIQTVWGVGYRFSPDGKAES